jgi:nitrogen regulatory protein PII
MRRIKIEIILQSTYFNKLLKIFDELKISGYTALEIIKGKGAKGGEVFASGSIPVYKNLLVFLICEEHEKEPLLEKIVPIVQQAGGLVIYYDVNRPDLKITS